MSREKKDLLLNEFIKILFFEQTHMAIYSTQSKRITDLRIAAFFDRFKHLEEEHVRKMELLIEKMGGEPKLLNKISPMAGYVGTAVLGADMKKVLKFNLILENKAVHGYDKPIKMADELGSGICDYLRENQLEAEMMGLWIREELTRFGGTDISLKANFSGPGSEDF